MSLKVFFSKTINKTLYRENIQAYILLEIIVKTLYFLLLQNYLFILGRSKTLLFKKNDGTYIINEMTRKFIFKSEEMVPSSKYFYDKMILIYFLTATTKNYD